MKMFYLAVTIGTAENKDLYSFVTSVSQNSNVVAVLEGLPGLKAANIYTRRKDAEGIVAFWNRRYKDNGTYRYMQREA